MMNYLYLGTAVGVLLYAGKMMTVYLIKRMLPFLKPVFHSIPGLLATDIGIGALGTKTITAMGGAGLTCVIIMTTFGFCTFLYISSVLAKKKAKNMIGGYYDFLTRNL